MSYPPLPPDDPRLTAYILGELDAADREAVEAHLAMDPQCRRAVEELQQTTASLCSALQSEPAPTLTEAQRAAIRAAAHRPTMVIVAERQSDTTRRSRTLAVLGAAAVCLAVMATVSLQHFSGQQYAATGESVDEVRLALTAEVETLPSGSRLNFAEGDPQQLERFRELSEHRATALAASGSGQRNIPGNLGDVDDLSTSFTQKLSGGRLLGIPASRRPTSLERAPQSGPAPHNSAAETSQPDASEEAPRMYYDSLRRAATPTAAAAEKDFVPLAPIGSVSPSNNVAGDGSASPPTAPADNRWGGGAYGAYSAPSPAVGESLQPKVGLAITETAPAQATPADKYYMGHNFQFTEDFGTNLPQGQQRTAAGRERAQRGGQATPPVSTQQSAEGLGKRSSGRLFLGFGTKNGQGQPGDGTVGKSPAQQSGQASSPAPSSGVQTGGRGSSENAPFSPGPPFKVIGRDQYGDDVIVGMVDPETFSTDLDIPFRQGSFELGVPEFSGFQPEAWNQQGQQSNLTVAGRKLAREGEWYYIEGAERPPIAGVVAVTRGDEKIWRVPATPLGRSCTHLCWIDGSEPQTPGTEAYAPIVENDFLSPTDAPLSTFGLDVDTASYANVRRFLMDGGRFPPPDAVRIEELVNYFTYSDREPAGDDPLAVSLEAAACPWETEHRLVRIGLKAKTMDLAERPPTTLVFLIDTSGSMRDENKLPLVKQSLRLLAREMTENDRIAIVTYNSGAGLLLDSTSGEQREEIIAAIDGLQADGSTNGEAGLKLAYEVATRHFIKTGQNRVILCTDGDFNVGTSETDPLVGMISEKRASGVFLSICGYGTGNIKDEKLERIADKGNGQYHYVDNLKEARKVFLDELSGTLYTVAKDVKLQVEFNPGQVAAYRLLGYENRALAAEDFNNDRVDSGDMGAGHSVTALYEIVPAGVNRAKPASGTPGVDRLKYQGSGVRSQESGVRDQNSDEAPSPSTLNPQPSTTNELLTVKLRYKQPDADQSVKREFPLVDDVQDSPSQDLEWSAAVASFGMLLRGSQHAGNSSLEGILELAQGARGRDESGRRREFIDMVLQTQSLVRKVRGQSVPEPRELSSVEARRKATVGGKYENLLDKLEMPSDHQRYGAFHDYGWSADKSYAGRQGLPAGYWVYVYPDWYIWSENVSADAK